MKKMFFTLLLFSQVMFYSCTEETFITDCGTDKDEIEILAEELQKFIDENNITVAHIYVLNIQDNSWVSENGCNGFKIESPFIKVCGTYYHLENLVKYRLNGSLELYFKY